MEPSMVTRASATHRGRHLASMATRASATHRAHDRKPNQVSSRYIRQEIADEN